MSEAESQNGKQSASAHGTNGSRNAEGNDDGFDLGIGGTQPSRKSQSTPPPKTPPPSEPKSAPPRSRKAAAADYEPVYEDPPRQPKAERADAFNATAWLIEGIGGMIDEIQHNDLGLPQDFWVHAYAARKEGLLAARALIDHAIQRSDEELAKAAEKEDKRTRRGGVDIDFGA